MGEMTSHVSLDRKECGQCLFNASAIKRARRYGNFIRHEISFLSLSLSFYKRMGKTGVRRRRIPPHWLVLRNKTLDCRYRRLKMSHRATRQSWMATRFDQKKKVEPNNSWVTNGDLISS